MGSPPDGPALLNLAAAVADGSNVDWDHAESSASDPHERAAIQQLRRLADIAEATRARMARWGPLEIRGELGGGAFGRVYRAWDPQLEREVALKLIDQSARASSSAALREGRLLAQVRHPNVVLVHGADVFEDRVGIWMELVHGQTLKEIVEAHGPFGAYECALIGREVCRALAAIHNRGFIHRDVKAQNVMREAGGRTVLMDLGAGEAVEATGDASALRGTPAYLAPELLTGGKPSVQSDLYSVGVLLYYLVSGEFPVTGASLEELRERHARGDLVPLRDRRADLPSAFVHAVDMALAADSSARPNSAGTLEAMLERALGLREGPESGSGRPSQGTEAGRRVRGRWLAAAMAILITTAAGGWTAWKMFSSPAELTTRKSVAVLPFRNLAPQGADAFLADGITQEVVARLTALPDLKVIAGASTRRYQGDAATPVAIGTALDVASVLDGTVQRNGDRVRIVSHLVDAATGEQLWADTFEREISDIFSLQAEVARRIALALRGTLTPVDDARLSRARGHDYEAYRLYQEGRQAWALRTEESLQKSVQLHQAAIRRDPGYALAYTGLADAYTSLGTYGYVPREEAFARSAAAAEHAVALDDSLAEAHASLGYAHKNRFAWQAAETHFRRAIDLAPGLVHAHHWYSVYLTQQGRFAEAITEVKAALSLDPFSVGANFQLASALLMARRFEDAIAQYQSALQMDPSFAIGWRGITAAYTYLGLYDRASRAAAEAARRRSLGGEDLELKADLGYLQAVSGRRSEALAAVRELTRRYEDAGEPLAVVIASISAGLGDRDRAFMWLARAEQSRDPELGYIKVDPRWDTIRKDPRFTTLLARLNLASQATPEGSR
jgi:TolB-like protein/Tfp pilus assembly protein PilF